MLLSIASRRVHRLAALTFFAGSCWLVLSLTQAHGRLAHRLVDGLAEWSLTLTAAVMLLARGIHLGRPVTATHAATASALLFTGVLVRLLSFPLIGDALVIAAAATLVAPMASRPDPYCVPHIWPLICQTHGDPLAPFAMGSQKSYFFNAEASAAVAYRTRGGLAVVSGDPIGREDAFADLAGDFDLMCRSRGWKVVVLGCSEHRIMLWRNATALHEKLRAVPIGSDVEVDVQHFSMAGRRYRNLRQAVSRTHNRGITTELVHEQDLQDPLAAELAEVLYDSHHGTRVERGFSMILDSALEGRYPGVVLMIGRNADGRIEGFHRYLIAGGGSDVTLDVPWRRSDAPNGLDERLAVDMIEWCRNAGTQRLSLAFAAFSDLFDNPNRTRLENFYHRVIAVGSPLIRLEPLYRYLRKFHALGQKRYVLVSLRHIPLALVVLLSLEFVPHRKRKPRV